MKNNYPIKYAIMSIIAQTGWYSGMHELEREYGVIVYIVSKCHLVEENKTYLKDGTVETNYNVVFPFTECEYGDWKRIEPEYNLITGQCTNCTTVNFVFNTYEEALKESKHLNEKLLLKKFEYRSIDEFLKQQKQIKEEFQKVLNHYKVLEELIEHKTDDLSVRSNFKKQTTIIIGSGKRGEYNTSLYNAMELWNNQNYVVYNLNEQDYSKVINELQSESNLSKYNKNCIAINNPLQKVIRINNGDDLFYLTPNELIHGNQENFNLISFDENQATIIFYTLEDSEDIIKSFLNLVNGDELLLNNKVMSKTLKI